MMPARLSRPVRRTMLSMTVSTSACTRISSAVSANSSATTEFDPRSPRLTSSIAWLRLSPASAQTTSRSSASGMPFSSRSRRRAAIRPSTKSGRRQPSKNPANGRLHRRIGHPRAAADTTQPRARPARRAQPRHRASRQQRWQAGRAPVFRPHPEDAAASRDRTRRPPGLPRRCCRAGDTTVCASRLPPVPGREPRRATPRGAPCAPRAGRCARD